MGNRCSNKKDKPETRTIYPSTVMHFDEDGQPFNPNAQYANNRIRTTKYSIWTFLPLNLWEQFHRFANVYFVFILILNFMPGVEAFAKEVAPIPVLLTLTVIAAKDAYEDFRRHLSDRRVNRRTCKVFSCEKSRYVDAKWETILPGDFVRLHTNEFIPADILLLKSSNVAGICHIETANLDGESNLKQREVVERVFSTGSFSPMHFTFPTEVETPSSQMYKFNGKIIRPDRVVPIRTNSMILRGCVLRNTDFIEGMVIYAGRETKAALNNTGPRFKRSKLEKRINLDVIWCVIILAAICFTGAVGSGVWQANLPGDDVLFVALDRNATTSSPAFQGFLNFWRFIILFQSIIPLPLYVSIELIKMHQVWHMSNDLALYDPRVDRRIQVRAFNILEDLGQIEYVFCDKTGTLTENKMEFKRASINGIEYATELEFSRVAEEGQQTSCTSTTGIKKFDSLREIVNEMSVLGTSAVEPGPHRTMGSSKRESLTNREKSNRHRCFIEDFIFILAVCNTTVVSATKNTATFFQVPTRRKGLRGFLRRSFSGLHLRRKPRKKSALETGGMVKHVLSLSSLLARRRRPPKADFTTIPRFEVHDEEEEESEKYDHAFHTESMKSTAEITQPDERIRDDQSTIASPSETPDGVSNQPRVKIMLPDQKVSTGTNMPSLVHGLSSDLPTPRHLLSKRSTVKKSVSALAGQWSQMDYDADSSVAEMDSESSLSLESPEAQHVATSETDNERLSVDFNYDQCSTRTLSVVAHDGSSYELSVNKDYVLDASGAGVCPLSDSVLLDSYESESPDEVTLVKTACIQGCKLLQRGLDFILLWLPVDGIIGVRVLHILPFDSIRKRMSILIRHPATNQAILYTKGADSAVLDRVKCSTEQERDRLKLTRQHINAFSRAGLRTLVLAKRVCFTLVFDISKDD